MSRCASPLAPALSSAANQPAHSRPVRAFTAASLTEGTWLAARAVMDESAAAAPIVASAPAASGEAPQVERREIMRRLTPADQRQDQLGGHRRERQPDVLMPDRVEKAGQLRGPADARQIVRQHRSRAAPARPPLPD